MLLHAEAAPTAVAGPAVPATSVNTTQTVHAPTCADCLHLSRYGNCQRPVDAGLAARYMLIAPPRGHAATCQAFEAKVAQLDSAERSGHWLIVPSAGRLERWFSPPVSRAELQLRYPGALLVALPDRPTEQPRLPTNEEAADLRHLVEQLAIREGFTPDEEEEALRNALADPAAALPCIRVLLNLSDPPEGSAPWTTPASRSRTRREGLA